jgi:hypothetical protein
MHFGLGNATKLDLLEVRWPSGKVEAFNDLEADKFYSILEGRGLVDPKELKPKAPVPSPAK